MFEINVTVNAPELAEALNNLAAALKGVKTSEADRLSVAPVPTAGQTSAAPSNTPAPVVPVTGAPAYTLDQISRAGASLVDAGKMQQLLELLGRYGVQAVTQLKPEQYGTFATELRALGAQI